MPLLENSKVIMVISQGSLPIYCNVYDMVMTYDQYLLKIILHCLD